MDPWLNKKFCDRCHKSLAEGFSMSRLTALKKSFSALTNRKR